MISLKMFVKLDDFLKYGVKEQIFQTPRRITPSLSHNFHAQNGRETNWLEQNASFPTQLFL